MKLVAYILVIMGLGVLAHAHETPKSLLHADCETEDKKFRFVLITDYEDYDTKVTVTYEGREIFKQVVDHEGEETGMYREITFWSTNYINGAPDVDGSVGYPGSYSREKPDGEITYFDSNERKFKQIRNMICKSSY